MSKVSSMSSLRLTFRCAARGLGDSWRWHRAWLLAAVGLHGAQALLPAVQVMLINIVLLSLVTSAEAVIGPLLALTAVVGAAFPIGQVAWQCSQRLGLRLTHRYRTQLAEAAGRAAPSQLADPEFVADLAGAELATGNPGLGMIPAQTLQLLATVVTATSLCLSIAVINPVSGIFVAAALLPTVVAFTIIARVELAGLPKLARASRRASYLTEQLLQQRTGTELATLQSGHKVARLVTAARKEFLEVLDGLTRFGTRMELACAAATAVLLAGALLTMVLATPNAAGAAAAIAGIISGLHAIRACGNAFGQLVTAAPKAQLYDRVLASLPAAVARTASRTIGSVEANDLAVTYPGAERPALDGVSFTARRGEMVAFVGVNGAGKTTTVNTLLGIVGLGRGTIRLDGDDINELDEPERLSCFGLLTQEFGRYEFTCRETVALGTPGEVSDEQVWRALHAASAADFVRQWPTGLDTQLGQQWGGVGMSGGQWQRLALARIQLRQAPVWILDEPTSAIDAEAERAVFEELYRCRADHITIVVSHRAWTLKAMDRIHVFDHGRIVEVGTFDALLHRGGRFTELFAGQQIEA